MPLKPKQLGPYYNTIPPQHGKIQIYKGFIQQPVDATNPTLTSIHNTIGTLIATRVVAGKYIISSSDPTNPTPFTEGKTFINCFADGYQTLPLSKAALGDHSYQIIYQAVNNILLQIQINSTGSFVEMYSFGNGAMIIPINIEIWND